MWRLLVSMCTVLSGTIMGFFRRCNILMWVCDLSANMNMPYYLMKYIAPYFFYFICKNQYILLGYIGFKPLKERMLGSWPLYTGHQWLETSIFKHIKNWLFNMCTLHLLGYPNQVSICKIPSIKYQNRFLEIFSAQSFSLFR